MEYGDWIGSEFSLLPASDEAMCTSCVLPFETHGVYVHIGLEISENF